VQAVKLSRQQIRELRAHLGQAPLENYELLWVLESCLETASSAVYGLGAAPWSAGLLILHRDCLWLQLENEVLLTSLLAPLPEQDIFRFYTTNPKTMDMLKRWFPQGKLSQSQLCVRNLTKNWRKRFDASVKVEPAENGGGQEFLLTAGDDVVARCTCQQVVSPWQEIMHWSLEVEQDRRYWAEHVFGAVTATILAQGYPAVVRVENEELYSVLEPLGYRGFSQLFFYVATSE